MAAKKQEPKDIKSETKWTAGKVEFQSAQGQKATEIRVVDWIIGVKHYVKLEKREFYMGDGGWKLGKASGFSLKDMEMIQDNWGGVMAALGSKVGTGATASGPVEPALATTVTPSSEDDF